jgi:hypothetical protein
MTFFSSPRFPRCLLGAGTCRKPDWAFESEAFLFPPVLGFFLLGASSSLLSSGSECEW